MACACQKKVNRKLKKEMGVEVEYPLMPFTNTPKVPAVLKITRVDGKRGKLPTITCTYCPFCGKKYED